MRGGGRKNRGGGRKGPEKRKGNFRGTKDRQGAFKKKKDGQSGGKKAFCFNRYRDKNWVKEELSKKKELDKKIEEQYETSESEEEIVDPIQKLMSTFTENGGNTKKLVAIESSEESESEEGSEVDESMETVEESKDSEDGSESMEEEEAMDDDEDDSSDSDASSSSEEMEVNANEEVKDGKMSESEDDGSEQEIEVEEAIEDKEIDIETEKDDTATEPEDPFTQHLRDELSLSTLNSVTNQPQNVETSNLAWPNLGRLIVQIPKFDPQKESNDKKSVTILEPKNYVKRGKIPQKITSVDWNKLHIKNTIHSNISPANQVNLIRRECEVEDKLTPIQKELFSVMNNYQDLYYPERSFVNSEEIRFVYCLHAVNHLLKTRTKILHHNARLSKKNEVPDEFRDQGLVRPKVIIVVPFKDAAYRIVKMIIDIVVPGDSSQVINKNRFESDFTGGELIMPKRNAKPEDYEMTFSGNTDDTFKMGISITKKSLKLYSDFYSSDLIIASPLGLRVVVGAEGEEDRDFDFLASVELLILDQTEIFLMQNWDHLLHVLDHLHLQPKKTHGTDFSRLRLWAVNGWTKYYRQTLIFSSVSLPEINSLFNKKCFNYAGKIRVHNSIETGSIRHVAVQVPQVFRRIEAKDPVSAIDSRFEYFIKEIVPQYKDSIMAHTLVYVPSYFDYVRIRNYFKKEDISFTQICEYSKDAKVARARDMFFHTEAQFLLYSERFHFFRRVRVKGIRHIVFYQPPTFPHFYSEMCNLMQEANQNKYGGSESNMTVSVMYTKYDLQQLSAIVGSERTIKMSQSERNTHMFMTGD